MRQILGWIVLISLLGTPLPAGAQPERDYNPDVPFHDVADHWAKEAIESAYQEGLLIGGDVFFQPDQRMSRAEFIVLVDRLFFKEEYQFYTLTLLMGHNEYGWGDGFTEPFLPYQDVDRLTWMYPYVLRVSLVMDRLYGPGALQEVFPGDKLHPAQPITKREAEALLRIFAIQGEEELFKTLWPSHSAEEQTFVRRADAAVAATRLSAYLETAPILPLLDDYGQKFPLVPELSELLFPVFETFFGEDTPQARQTYLQAVERVRTGVETTAAFRQLRLLAGSRFSNQVGVRYYLSWDDSTPLAENLHQAYLALDEYIQAGRSEPEVLQLLAANVYDLALQLEYEQPTVMQEARQRLLGHLGQLEQGTAEWLTLSLYIAALEASSGDEQQAIARYQQLVETKEGLTNAVYYLLSSGRMTEADQLLAQAQASAQLEQVYLDRLRQELNLFAEQEKVAKQLAEALEKLEASPGVEIDGEAMRNDHLYRYHTKQDRRNGVIHTQGIFQAPDKLVLQKLEAYTDLNNRRFYLYDNDTAGWQQSRLGSKQYVYESLETLSVSERLHQLGARYLLQEGEKYAVITEWIPQASLTERSAALAVSSGKLLAAPVYVNKYYLDRASGQLVRRVWHYEELYESGQYMVFLGEETYKLDSALRLQLPSGVVKGGR